MEIKTYSKGDKASVGSIFTQYWTDHEFLDELKKELDSDKYNFFVAEERGEVIGIAGWGKVSNYLSRYASTKKPVELYIIASKYRGKGIGNVLIKKIIEEAKNSGFTEMLCYSPETHNGSWKFYETLGFIKQGIINNPDDNCPGMLWKKSML